LGGDLSGNVTLTNLASGTLTATVGTLNQSTTGNAATATALQTARTIGGVSFDGTANINLPGVNTAGTQDTSGNAATATALATGRNFSLTGNVTASAVSFDGTGNVALATTLADSTVTSAKLSGALTTPSDLTVSGAFTSQGIDDNADATAITIDSSENVMIGTTDAQIYDHTSGEGIVFRNGEAIDVARSGDSQMTLNRMSDEGANISLHQAGTLRATIGTKGSGGFYIGTSGDNERMRIDSSGNVGIGTSNPATLLHVESGATASTIIRVKGTVADGYRSGFEAINGHTGGLTYSIFSTNNSDGIFGGGKFVIGNDATNSVNASTAGLLVMDSSGKVGIGTTSPDVKLDVRGEVAVDYNATYGLRFYNQSRNNWSSIGNPSTSSDADMVFKSGGGEAMRILHNKRVGIGTSSPGYLFHVNDSASGGTSFQFQGNGPNLYTAMTNTSATNYIGVNGTQWEFYCGGTLKFQINTTNGGQTVSDQKFKKDIEDISYGLDTVKALQPRKFKWKENEESMIGFIAQEVKPVISEIITEPLESPEGLENGMTLNYSALTAVLTKAVQEQQAIIEDLQKQINEVKNGN